MDNYENMTKEQLIAEIERLKIDMEEVEDFYKRILDQNNKLNDLLKSIQFLLDNSYDNIRNN
jgi:predicted nuclease with TOPRIM domain